MKNLQFILFTMAMMVLSFNSSGQLIVDQQGQVGIGTWYNTHTNVGGNSRLDISGKTTISVWPANAGFIFTNIGSHPLFRTNYYTYKGYLGTNSNWWYRAYIDRIYYHHLFPFSDRGIKENIKPLPNSLDKIMAINTVSFDLKKEIYKGSDPDDLEKLIKDGKNQVGVIAQEIKEIFPNLVEYQEDCKLYAVKYIDLIPYLIKATQEQQAIIEELKGEIKILKDRK